MRCYGEPERGAFCEASDKPCSQSRAGSGIIGGCTRGRKPSLAHWIGFLFTRAWSPDSSNQSRPRTTGDGEERGSETALPSPPVCLPVCLAACAFSDQVENLRTRRLRMQWSRVRPVCLITLSPINSPQ